MIDEQSAGIAATRGETAHHLPTVRVRAVLPPCGRAQRAPPGPGTHAPGPGGAFPPRPDLIEIPSVAFDPADAVGHSRAANFFRTHDVPPGLRRAVDELVAKSESGGQEQRWQRPLRCA